jgi:hypothetical protein
VEDAAPANARLIVDDHIRINDAVITDIRPGFDGDSLKNGDVVSDDDMVTDSRERPHRHIRSQLGARRDAGLGRHAFRHWSCGKPAGHDFRQRKVGIINADPAFVVAFKIRRHEDDAGFRVAELRGVFSVA